MKTEICFSNIEMQVGARGWIGGGVAEAGWW